jgi:hypothetical protein
MGLVSAARRGDLYPSHPASPCPAPGDHPDHLARTDVV